jgi:hypothetical protein
VAGSRFCQIHIIKLFSYGNSCQRAIEVMVDIEVDPANDNGDLKDAATPCELLDGENGGNERHAKERQGNDSESPPNLRSQLSGKSTQRLSL